MTKEDIQATEKYLDKYSMWCSNHTCDEESCPVFVVMQENRKNKIKTSCFRSFCKLCEEGKI